MWEKTKVMRISKQPSPITITIDQKQLENVKCFKYHDDVEIIQILLKFYKYKDYFTWRPMCVYIWYLESHQNLSCL